MRAIVAFIALLCFGLTNAHAQTAAQVEQKLSEIGVWAQGLHAISADLVALYQTSDELNDIQDRFIDGDLKEEAALTQISAWRARFGANLDALSSRVDAFPTPPRMGDTFGPMSGDLQRLVDGMNGRYHEAIARSLTFGDAMTDMARQGVSGELDATEAAMRRALTLARQLIQSANDDLALMLALASPSHPSYNVASGRIALNNATLAIVEVVFGTAIEGRVVFSDQHRAAMRDAAQLIRDQVRTGHASGRTAVARLGPPLTPSLHSKMVRFYASIDQSLDTLSQCADIVERAANFGAGAKIDVLFGIMDELDVVEAALDRQNLERAQIMAEPTPPI